MPKLTITRGASSSNSVTYFANTNKGYKATRQEDGTIVTEEVGNRNNPKTVKLLLKIILICALFRYICLFVNLPNWMFHTPTVFYIMLLFYSICILVKDHEWRMYHGAEHKVIHWYSKNDKEPNFESMRKISRIHKSCGSNLLAVFVTFQIISSVCMEFFGIHIPELVTIILPLFLYEKLPFNIPGMMLQLITTATPTEKHIEVAVSAMTTLIENMENK